MRSIDLDNDAKQVMKGFSSLAASNGYRFGQQRLGILD